MKNLIFSVMIIVVVFSGIGFCSCPDLNNDKKVNLKDFSSFANSWQEENQNGDFNEDGLVNIEDLYYLLTYWLCENPIFISDIKSSVNKKGIVRIYLEDNCSNTDLTYEIIQSPSNGGYVFEPNSITYIPKEDFIGFDEISLVANKNEINSNPFKILIEVMQDSDEDGISDKDELEGKFGYVTNIYSPDSDLDSMPDGWEIEMGLNPLVRDETLDPDNDGLQNKYEYRYSTHPFYSDCDEDGIKDGHEVTGNLSSYGPIYPFNNNYPDWYYTPYTNYNTPTDPLNYDSDSDGVSDLYELKWGLNPNNPDSDSDGLTDGQEVSFGNGSYTSYRPYPLWYNLYGTGVIDCDLNANSLDTDSDTMIDPWEVKYQTLGSGSQTLDPRVNLAPYMIDTTKDADGDGLNNLYEYTHNTNPCSWDTDGDGRYDYDEIYGTTKSGQPSPPISDPTKIDSDEDGLVDGYNNVVLATTYPKGISYYNGSQHTYVLGEKTLGTNPLNTDSDNDGMSDNWEVRNWDFAPNTFLSPSYNYPNAKNMDLDFDTLTNLGESQQDSFAYKLDSDNDGLNDASEKIRGTNPLNTDSDNDGLLDGLEITNGTDPLNYDSDDDFLPDGWEVKYNFPPLISDVWHTNPDGTKEYFDSDYDGLDDFEECVYGTNPKKSDSDSDGVNDLIEVNQGTDPLDKLDKIAPDQNEVCELRLTVGDHSLSESERYTLRVGNINHMAHKFGEVESAVYKFRVGKKYPVTIIHNGSTKEEPDYDYTAIIEEEYMPQGVVLVKNDPCQVLGEHSDLGTTEFYAEGKSVEIGIFAPKHTNLFRGNKTSSFIGYTVMYYQQVLDEEDKVIDIEGFLVEEEVIKPNGKTKYFGTGKGYTSYHAPEGEWTGGIGFRDKLWFPRSVLRFLGYDTYYQTIIVNGVRTTPRYLIRYDEFNIENDDIWKEPIKE